MSAPRVLELVGASVQERSRVVFLKLSLLVASHVHGIGPKIVQFDSREIASRDKRSRDSRES